MPTLPLASITKAVDVAVAEVEDETANKGFVPPTVPATDKSAHGVEVPMPTLLLAAMKIVDVPETAEPDEL